MTFDLERYGGTVERSVTPQERDGQRAFVVTLSRVLEAAPDDAWDAVTGAERIPRWFLPITGDLALGGRYQLEGNAGGEITTCEPGSHVAVTWEFAGDVSWVDVRLAKEGDGRVRLTLAHAQLHSPFWDHYGPGATGVGWETALMGLAMHLEDPDAVMPDVDALLTSSEGMALVERFSEAWARAAIDAGEDAGAADLAARRTAAFYTGREEPAE